MELYDVMRTTFAAREFTDDPVPDEVLHRILDNARFAPSGGNRQGAKVILARSPEVKRRLGELCLPGMRVAKRQAEAGEVYWQSVTPTSVDREAAAADETVPVMLPNLLALEKTPVVLVLAVDLRVVASTDQLLDRVGVISGASIYPLAWNILLAARNEGFGGTLTTMIAANEPAAQELLGLAPHEAVAALLPIGKPVKQLTRLTRRPVEDFVVIDHADGRPFTL